MRITAGIVGVLLILAIVYFILPVGVKRVVNPFYKNTTTATRTSPAPSSRAAVSSDAPDLFVNATTTPRASATAIALASTKATATPRASASVDPFATASPNGTRVAGLPGTGDEERNPEFLVIELLASVLVIMFGYKLSKHL